jgi:hypothetical protein
VISVVTAIKRERQNQIRNNRIAVVVNQVSKRGVPRLEHHRSKIQSATRQQQFLVSQHLYLTLFVTDNIIDVSKKRLDAMQVTAITRHQMHINVAYAGCRETCHLEK